MKLLNFICSKGHKLPNKWLMDKPPLQYNRVLLPSRRVFSRSSPPPKVISQPYLGQTECKKRRDSSLLFLSLTVTSFGFFWPLSFTVKTLISLIWSRGKLVRVTEPNLDNQFFLHNLRHKHFCRRDQLSKRREVTENLLVEFPFSHILSSSFTRSTNTSKGR